MYVRRCLAVSRIAQLTIASCRRIGRVAASSRARRDLAAGGDTCPEARWLDESGRGAGCPGEAESATSNDGAGTSTDPSPRRPCSRPGIVRVRRASAPAPTPVGASVSVSRTTIASTSCRCAQGHQCHPARVDHRATSPQPTAANTHQREYEELDVEPGHRRGDGVLHRPDVRDRLIRIDAANLILNRRRHRERWRGGPHDEEHVRERELVRRHVHLGLIALVGGQPFDVAYHADHGEPPRLGIQFPGNGGSMIRGPNAPADGGFIRPEAPCHRFVHDGDAVGGVPVVIVEIPAFDERLTNHANETGRDDAILSRRLLAG